MKKFLNIFFYEIDYDHLDLEINMCRQSRRSHDRWSVDWRVAALS